MDPGEKERRKQEKERGKSERKGTEKGRRQLEKSKEKKREGGERKGNEVCSVISCYFKQLPAGNALRHTGARRRLFRGGE